MGGRQRAVAHVHPDDDTVKIEKAILSEFKVRFPRHTPWIGAIMLRFTAVFPVVSGFTVEQRAAAARGELYHTAKPDKDNIEKLLTDALNGAAWVDDAQIQGGGVKRYGSPPRIDVVLELLPTPSCKPIPADKRAAERLALHQSGERPLGVKTKRTKSEAKLPPHLQARVDAAIARDKRK